MPVAVVKNQRGIAFSSFPLARSLLRPSPLSHAEKISPGQHHSPSYSSDFNLHRKMGVFGTFCQVCAMPLQQNCYVSVPDNPEMLAIYRGAWEDAGNPPAGPLPIQFGPEHEWLLRAAALRCTPAQEPQALLGSVQDGDLTITGGGPAPPRAFTDPLPETVDLEDGVGERCGVHERCWELAGKCEFEDIKGIAQGESWQELEKKYHAQLFDFQRMREKDEAWMIVDPETGSEEGQRNKARILQMLGKPA